MGTTPTCAVGHVRTRSKAARPAAGAISPSPRIAIRPPTRRRAAAPTSDQAPQLMLSAVRPRARRWNANASRNALAAAWLPWPGDPSSEATEENMTKKSSGMSSVARCRFHEPSTLGAMTPAKRATDCCIRTPSSSTPAAWITPRRGGSSRAMRAMAAETSPGRETSPRRTSTLAPDRASWSMTACSSGPGARRAMSARWRAPRATRRPASSRPSPPRPPTTR